MEDKTIEKILDLIKKMEQNKFLLPDSWSDETIMVSRNAHYKTYVGHRGDFQRYINIEYVDSSELHNPKQQDCYCIEIRKNEIFLNKRLGDAKNEVDFVLDIVESIYKEKFSFEIMDSRVAEKRKEMKQLQASIKYQTERFNKIKTELEAKKKITVDNPTQD